MRKIILCLVLIGTSLKSYSQLTVVPTQTITDINSVGMDGDTLLILGRNNYLSRSVDLGETVTLLNIPSPEDHSCFDLQVRSGYYYYYASQTWPFQAHIMRSKNKGEDWDNINTAEGVFLHMEMYDTTLGIIGSAGGGDFEILQNWDENWQTDTLFGQICASQFYNDSIGIVLSNSVAFLTEDRGETWQWAGHIPWNVHRNLQYISQDTIYIASWKGQGPTSQFSYSFDGGLSFSSTHIGYDANISQDVFFSSTNDLWFDTPSHGFLFGSYRAKYTQQIYGCIYETNDGGQSWEPFMTNYEGEFTDHEYYNDSISFIAGTDGLVLKWNRNIQLVSVLGVNEEATSEPQIKFSPNPAEDQLIFDFPDTYNNLNFQIYSMSGQVVYENRLIAKQHDISRLSPGIYIVNILDGTKVISNTKLIKH